MFGKWAARKGSIGSTARWTADAFWGGLSQQIIDIENVKTNEGLEVELDKLVEFALGVRFGGDVSHPELGQILSFYKSLKDRAGLFHNFNFSSGGRVLQKHRSQSNRPNV